MQIDLPGIMGLKVHLFNGLDGVTHVGSGHMHHMNAGSWVNNGHVMHHSPSFAASHMGGAFHHSANPLGGEITLPSDHVGGMLLEL